MLLGGLACGDRAANGDAAADTTALQSAGGVVAGELGGSATSDLPADTVHAFEGTWDLASVAERLEGEGLTPRPAGGVQQPFMGVPGTRFLVDGGEVQVFLYADVAARARDTDPVDSGEVQLPHTDGATPTMITSNNVAALLLARSPAVRDRVRHALQLSGRTEDEP